MKKIAVIICGIEYHNQQEFMHGVFKYGKEHGGNIFVFICNADYRQSDEYKSGAFKIYDFVNPQEYDGVILLRETIHYQPAQKYIVQKLKESGVPVISINARTEGMGYIGFDDYDAMYRMTEHVILDHGIREVAFINGPEGYSDAVLRAQAFRDVLKKEEVAYQRCWFYQGDFNVEAGMNAVQEFDRMHRMPEAIVCSNDSMAAGAIMQLQEMGYRVPEDILVTGFDDVLFARDNSPRITTVRCDREKMGYLACGSLMTKTPEEIRNLSILIPTEQIYAGSCGCDQGESEDAEELKRRFLRRTVMEKRYRNKFNEMFSQFVVYDRTEDFLESIRRFIPELRADYFYIAFRNMEIMTKRMIQHYRHKKMVTGWGGIDGNTESYSMPLIYEKGRFSSHEKLEKGQILPGTSPLGDEGTIYFVMPMHYQEQFFGYCVVGNCELSMESELLSQWLEDLGRGIESALEKQALQRIMEKLDRMSTFDNLTGLYNRVGFQTYADEYKGYAKSSGRNMFMSFIDIDGLKKVNDTYGHRVGDRLIRNIADCLRGICRDKEVCMRFGGDEFVVLGLENVADSRHLEFEREFQQKLQSVNEEKKREYIISASIGSYLIEDVERTNLQVMLERADMEMYLRKKAKRRKEASREIL